MRYLAVIPAELSLDEARMRIWAVIDAPTKAGHDAIVLCAAVLASARSRRLSCPPGRAWAEIREPHRPQTGDRPGKSSAAAAHVPRAPDGIHHRHPANASVRPAHELAFRRRSRRRSSNQVRATAA